MLTSTGDWSPNTDFKLPYSVVLGDRVVFVTENIPKKIKCILQLAYNLRVYIRDVVRNFTVKCSVADCNNIGGIDYVIPDQYVCDECFVLANKVICKHNMGCIDN